MTMRRMLGFSEVEHHSAERLRLNHFAKSAWQTGFNFRPVLQTMSAGKRKLTPERLMANIRSYEADYKAGRTSKDLSEAIASHLGARERTGGSAGETRRGATDPTESQSEALIQWAQENGAVLDARLLPSFVTSQPNIEGPQLTESEIEKHFKRFGFLKISDSLSSYYHDSDNTLILDAHSGNVTLSPDQKILGYDLVIIEPKNGLKSLVQRDYGKALQRRPAPTGPANFMDAARRVLKTDSSRNAES